MDTTVSPGDVKQYHTVVLYRMENASITNNSYFRAKTVGYADINFYVSSVFYNFVH